MHRRFSFRQVRGCRAALLAGLGFTVAASTAGTFTWQATCGASNNWHQKCTDTNDQCSVDPTLYRTWNNWGLSTCGATPGPQFPAPADDVFLNAGTARLTGAAAVWNLSLQPNGALDIASASGELAVTSTLENYSTLTAIDGGTLVANDTTVNNAGTIYLRYGGMSGAGHIRSAGTAVLGGSGAIVAETGVLDGTGTLVNAPGHTIRGGNGDFTVTLVNRGLISADVDNGYLRLRGPSVANAGTIQAINGSRIELRTSIDQNAGESRADGADSVVQFYTGAALTGGITSSANGGRHFADNADFTLTNITNAGIWGIQNGSVVTLRGSTLTNDGLMEVGLYTGGSGWPTLNFSEPVTVTGTGRIEFSGAEVKTDPGVTVTHAAGHTLCGGNGRLRAALTNYGVIDATTTGLALALRDEPKTNAHLMRASNGAYLDISTTVTQTPTGVITADGTNSRVRLYTGSAITGGALSSTNEGQFEAGYGTNIWSDLTHTGNARFVDGSTLVLTGTTLTNHGTIGLYAGGGHGWSTARCDAPVTLAGTGALEFSGGYLDTTAGVTMTNGVGHTLRGGEGQIRASLLNQGLILANQSAKTLALATNPKVNDGTIRATDGGYVALYVALAQGPGGQLTADGAASRVRFYSGSSVTGGTIETTGDAYCEAGYGTYTWANLTHRGLARFTDGATFVLPGGTLVNDGTLGLYYGGGHGGSHAQVTGDVLLTGGGDLLIDTGDVTIASGVTLTNGPAHTIHGRNTLTGTLVNEGTLLADRSEVLTFNPQTLGSTNHGTVTVQTGCRLTINNAAFFAQTGGRTRVDGLLTVNGGALTLQGGVLCGAGTLNGNVANVAAIVAPGSSPGQLQINGTYTQGADAAFHAEIGGPAVGTQYDRLAVSGAATLAGELRVDACNGFYAQPGQAFTILTAASRTGTFERVTGSQPCTVTYTATSVVITTLAPSVCLGDGNCDGVVNWRDIDFLVAAQNDNVSAWIARFGASGPACTMQNLDTNCDGYVNWRDIAPFIALMNSVCP